MSSEIRSLVRAAGVLLVLACAAGAQADAAPARRLAELERRLAELQAPWHRDFRAARDEGARDALLDEVPGRELVPELEALAGSTLGTDVALRAWTRLFGLGKELRDDQLAARALRRIVAEHLASPELAELCGFLGSWSRPGRNAGSEAALRAIAAGSPHRTVRAAALYHLATMLAQAEPTAARAAEARARLVALRDEYGELASWRPLAETALFELEHLQVGDVAPDFEAVDQAGAAFRLADARGEVVLLHFFGFW